MAVPSFNGEYIFGYNVQMATGWPDPAHQINAFLGVRGVERLFLGQRMLQTHVVGELRGPTELDLGVAETYFGSYQNQYGYVLYDTLGRTWNEVCLVRFEPGGRVMQNPAAGAAYWFRAYRATFDHLIPGMA
jgi:hypothetical protein